MELLSILTSQLGISEEQAAGGTGILMGMAKEKLGGAFSQISAAIPEVSALIDQAPPDGPLQRARAGEDVALDDPLLQEGIMTLAAQRAETVEATSARLLNNLEVAKGVPSGTYSSLNSAIQAENLTPMVRSGLIREIMGAGAPVTVDPNFGEVAFGDTLVLADARQGNIASAVRESELVVILKFFPDCDYDGMIAALDVIRRNGVSRTGITLQERLGGGV